MTQANGNNSRLDRIESIMFDLATASVRHDNTLERLESLIGQHDQALSRIENQQQLNAQAIAELTANMLDLRTLVANYIQNCSGM
jgi:chromosome segregation ATPase